MSTISPNLNSNYPIAGQDNDTQGFRTAWVNIDANFTAAAADITALEGNVTILQANAWVTAPATITSTGNVGQMAFSSSHIYVCVASDTWRRASIGTW